MKLSIFPCTRWPFKKNVSWSICPFLNCITFFFFLYYWVLIFCYLLCDFHIFSSVLLEFYLLSFCCLSDVLWSTLFYFWCGPVCFIYLLLAVLGLHCCPGFFSSCGRRGFSQVCHPHCGELPCCGAQKPGHAGCSSFGTWLCSRGSQALQHKLRNYGARA